MLRGIQLVCGDYTCVLSRLTAGDLVYADPPYTVRHGQNGFRKYNERLFSWDDQVRLADRVGELAARGVTVLVSKADHQSLGELYRGFDSVRLRRRTAVSGDPAARGQVSELLFVSSAK